MGRLRSGTWRANGRVRGAGYYGASRHLGIYIWEYINVLSPMVEAMFWADRHVNPDPRAYQPPTVPKSHDAKLIMAILSHGGYHCADADCILECVQELAGAR
jgi:hypothetical protein